MGTGQRYNQEFNEAVVKKLLSKGNQTIEQFCAGNNLALSTVSRWQHESANASMVWALIKNEKI